MFFSPSTIEALKNSWVCLIRSQEVCRLDMQYGCRCFLFVICSCWYRPPPWIWIHDSHSNPFPAIWFCLSLIAHMKSRMLQPDESLGPSNSHFSLFGDLRLVPVASSIFLFILPFFSAVQQWQMKREKQEYYRLNRHSDFPFHIYTRHEFTESKDLFTLKACRYNYMFKYRLTGTVCGLQSLNRLLWLLYTHKWPYPRNDGHWWKWQTHTRTLLWPKRGGQLCVCTLEQQPLR